MKLFQEGDAAIQREEQDLFWKLERVDCAKSKMSCTERMVRWGHRDAKALIEWLGYYDKAFELPLKTGGSTDRLRFGF